jgi:DNA modification methylase
LIAALSFYTELREMCIWVKDHASSSRGSLYSNQHELVYVFKNGRSPERNKVGPHQHRRSRSNVWNYPGPQKVRRHGKEGNLTAAHPTVKPVALIADVLLDSSARGDVLLDPFLGIGSTLLAAERVGRVCRGMELDPIYVDAAIQRWQQMTGEDAIDAKTGQSFHQVRRGRGQ